MVLYIYFKNKLKQSAILCRKYEAFRPFWRQNREEITKLRRNIRYNRSLYSHLYPV